MSLAGISKLSIKDVGWDEKNIKYSADECEILQKWE
jgi:hypothetical protein